ncbi:fumarylacetoacetate hydrolase family protein [Ketobacter alkanivorans]|uniref:Fumarylacetoacetate hydrolase n=1 Tax=Ketobacter alkanivorans TaxID=1917421 RepID=A0A2K9LPG5_9GAMM|nr:fumarylacetoacetate hydrolase family protein [Ketobacter alkanivorans]AUM14183.1 fumarylacetoacetate hydrolase [Ketobacter alkanivorans]MCP5018729.1 fumarylacetoacetate hydrolase family protein [Ketobacter sp.]
MPTNIVRFEAGVNSKWGLLRKGRVHELDIPCTTTAELLSLGVETIHQSVVGGGSGVDIEKLKLLSPVTAPAKVLCQGANYRQHMIDSGMDPDEKTYNMFFTKSTASITAPVGVISKPKFVRLLDYEIELTLVLGKKTNGALKINRENLHEYVAGICIGNDVSARDVQIPQMQFHKGKSYRTFCPLGPVLCLLSKNEMHYLDELQLQLTVNGEVRQQDSTANLVFKPADTLEEYSQIHDFEPGDVLLTGTPSGCALGLPSPTLVKVSGLLPEAKRWELFLKMQLKRPQYLSVGDKIESTIKSSDGVIDLGRQQHVVECAYD